MNKSEQYNAFIKHLHPDAVGTVALTSNVKVQGKEEKQLNSFPMSNLENREKWQSTRFQDHGCLGKDHTLVILDIDDHNGTLTKDQITGFKKAFNLTKTLAVKTPSGKGLQLLYKVPSHLNERLMGRGYSFADFPNVEVFVSLKPNKQRRVVPGSSKAEGDYTLLLDAPIADLPMHMLEVLQVQSETQFEDISKDSTNYIEYNSKGSEDSQHNFNDARDFVNQKIVDPVMNGEESFFAKGRNNALFQLSKDVAKYNLSKEKIRQLYTITFFGIPAIWETNGFDEEEITTCIEQGYNAIREEGRATQRASRLVPFEKNDEGHYTIDKKDYIAKAEHVLKYEIGKILRVDDLRRQYWELVIKDGSNYHVPRKRQVESYRRNYEQSVANEEANDVFVDLEILREKTETELHWVLMSEKEFNAVHKYPSGKVMCNPSGRDEFNSRVIHARVVQTKLELSTNICEYGTFYAEPKSAIRILNKYTQKDRLLVEKLIDTLLKNVVDPDHFAEEKCFLLDRFAKIIQNPLTRTENILVLHGPYGSGKSIFVNLMSALLPLNFTSVITSSEELDVRFTHWKPLTHIDDIDLNEVRPLAWNRLKALTTMSNVPLERKGVDMVLTGHGTNISIGTNTELETPSVILGDRRTTYVSFNEYIDQEEVAGEVKDVLQQLKDHDFHLLSVLKTMLSSRDTSAFSPKYKTHAQLALETQSAMESKLLIAVLFAIKNYGYMSNDLQLFVPNGRVPKLDMVAYYNHTVRIREGYTLDIEEYTIEQGTKLITLTENMPDKKKVRSLLKKTFSDNPSSLKASKINDNIQRSFDMHVPFMKDWIRFAATIMYNTEGLHIKLIEEFGFQEQWDWDGKTKPDDPSLGSLNPLENTPYETLNQSDDDF